MAAMLMDQARTVFDDYKKQSMHDQLAFREASEDFKLQTRAMQCEQRQNSDVWNGMSYGPNSLSGMNAMGPYGLGGMNAMNRMNPYGMSPYGMQGYGMGGYGAMGCGGLGGYGGIGPYAGAYGAGQFMNPMALNNPMLAGAALNASMAYPLQAAAMAPMNSVYSRTSGGYGYY